MHLKKLPRSLMKPKTLLKVLKRRLEMPRRKIRKKEKMGRRPTYRRRRKVKKKYF